MRSELWALVESIVSFVAWAGLASLGAVLLASFVNDIEGGP